MSNKLFNSPCAFLFSVISKKSDWTLAVIIFALCVLSAQAQQLAGRPERGSGGKGAEVASGIDNINLQNGNVSLQIPLASLPPVAGGKLSYTLQAYYNSSIWNAYREEVKETPYPDCHGVYTREYLGLGESAGGSGGWQIGGQYEIIFREAWQDYQYLTPNGTQCHGDEYYLMQGRFFKPVLKMPDGSEHEMRIDNTGFPVYMGSREHLFNYYRYQGSNALPFNSQIRLYTVDGTFITATYDPTGNYTIYLKDGTQIQPATGGGQRIKDTNGNSILITSGSAKDEQTNREIKWSQTTYNGNEATKVEYQAVGGVWQTVWVVWGTTQPTGILYTVKDWDPNAGTNGATCNKQVVFNPESFKVIREIILPVTESGVQSQKFSFAYNSDSSTSITTSNVKLECGAGSPPAASYTRNVSGLGEVSQITMPTGALTKYTYVHNTGTGLSGTFLDSDRVIKNGVKVKEVVHDNTTDIWNYNTPFNSFTSNTSVTNADGSTYTEEFYPTDLLRSIQGGTNGLGGLVYRSKQSNKIMTERKWILLGGANLSAFGSGSKVSFNPVVDVEYTTLLDDSGNRLEMSAKKYLYDYNGELKQTIEYDWFKPNTVTFSTDTYQLPTGIPASATPLRTTANNYYNEAGTSNDSNAYHKRTVGTSTVILGVLKDTTITGTSSQTRYSYDGQSWGTVPTKGNLTTISAYSDITGQFINSSIGYDNYGNATSKTDPNNNVTQIFYEDATHAMPTKTIVDPQNGSGQQVSTTTYDFYTGLPLNSTDINGNVSTISYTNHLLNAVDPFGRPGTVYSPQISINGVNQRQTVKTYYEDAAKKTRVEADLFVEGDGLLKTRETRDQLGRTILSERNENGAAAYSVSSQTIYKTAERVLMSSNPRRVAAATTDGWTRVTRDLLGRTIEAAAFSGATVPPTTGGITASNFTGRVLTSYSANQTTATDQAGKKRRSVTNGLGQLARVDEPNADTGTLDDASGNPMQSTSYTYDMLGNLGTVAQGGQTRTFVYDSLSRLKEAQNPESGIIKYTYDTNGNLKTKLDARGIKTIYDYDGLNRLMSRCYKQTSGGALGITASCAAAKAAGEIAEPNSKDASYTYDNLTNAKGRLTKVVTGDLQAPFSMTDYQTFDKLGRVLQSQQTTDGTTYNQMTYTYNLSGALVEQKYPSGRIVKNQLNNGGELTSVTSKKNVAGQFWNYASNFSYTAAGAVSQMQLGNLNWESANFNSHLQPTQIALGKTQNTTNLLQLDYNYGTSDNNGNIKTQTITVPSTSGQSNGFTATQTYNYDSLNRLKDATETITGTGQTWKQTYNYDRFGNRRFDETTGATTTLPRGCTTSVENSYGICEQQKNNPHINDTVLNNRLKYYDYDVAGNMTTDTGNHTGDPNKRRYTYDGENKQTKVERLDANGLNVIGTIGKYFYDGDGRRIKKITYNQYSQPSETTIFVYDASGKLVAEYSTVVETENAKVGYLTSDYLGSPRIITDKNGNVTSRRDFLPFGEEIGVLPLTQTAARGNHPQYSGDNTRQKFTSYERDAESGLDYAQARMYSNQHGRFTSPDDFLNDTHINDPQSWNLYVYARNNPLINTDPDGKKIIQLGRAISDIENDISNIDEQLKDKELSPEKRARLLSQRSDLVTELNANRVVSAWINALKRAKQDAGLTLSEFSVMTNPRNDMMALLLAGGDSPAEAEAYIADGERKGAEATTIDGKMYIATMRPEGSVFNLSLLIIDRMAQGKIGDDQKVANFGGADIQAKDALLLGGIYLRHELQRQRDDNYTDTVYKDDLKLIKKLEKSFSSKAVYSAVKKTFEQRLNAGKGGKQ